MANDPDWRLPEVPSFSLVSPEFRDGDRLPQWARAAGGGGEDRSPHAALGRRAVGHEELRVLTVFDPDAPTGSGWRHWAVYNLPATITRRWPRMPGNPDAGLPPPLPPGAVTVPNESRERRFEGAYPPDGHGDHRLLLHPERPRRRAAPSCRKSARPRCSASHQPDIVARAQLIGISSTP